MEVELRGLESVFPEENINDGHGYWIEWRALDLYDPVRRQKVSEWFYVAACSPRYLTDNPKGLSQDDQEQLLVQDVFNEEALVLFATKKFRALSFSSWDDFYDKMSKTFMYEERDDT